MTVKNVNSRELNLIKKIQVTFHVAWMTFGLRDQHTEMVLHQSYCCEIKYCEKQIGFSHGNLYNLAFKLYTRENVAFCTKRGFSLPPSMVRALPKRESLDFDYLK